MNPSNQREIERLQAENAALQERLRKLEEQCADYRQALIERLNNEVKEEDWRDFREEDFRIPMATILRELDECE